MQKKDNDLIGIKAVADYLNMSVRNVYYWEKKLGLPLHRISGGSGYRIYAYKDELDRWLKRNTNIPSKQRVIKLWLPIVGIIPPILVLAFIFLQSFGGADVGPVTFSYEKNVAYLLDSKEKAIWHFTYKNNLNSATLREILDFKDVDNDSQNELIACVYDISSNKFFLTYYDYGRGVVWRKEISPGQTFNRLKIDNFFRPGPVRFARDESGNAIIISKWNHQARFLSIIACHDLSGNLLYFYHHTGHLTHTLELIDLDKNGIKEIVFTGTNNLLNGEGIVGVLPITGFHGVSPPCRIEPEYTHLETRLKKYLADDFTPGNQLAYIRFKKTPYLSKYEEYYNNTEIIYSSNDVIQFSLFPWRIGSGMDVFGFDYVFNPDFSLREVLEQWRLMNFFPLFSKNGDVDIPLERLKEIYSGIVHRWDSGNWIPLTIQSTN